MVNGSPSIRLWHIGTHHVYGIFSDLEGFRTGVAPDGIGIDNEGPDIPDALQTIFFPDQSMVYADFEICPLEPRIEGHMQAACIKSVCHVVVDKF